MAALLDLVEQALDDIRRADGLPVHGWKAVERQTGVQVAVQAGHGGRVDGLIFFNEGGRQLVSFLATILVSVGKPQREAKCT